VKKEGPAIRRVVLYNRDPDGEVKKLVFKYYSNESELLTAADLGEVDSFISSDQFMSDRFKLHRFSLEGIYYGLFFNLREEKLQDQDFRLKLAQVLPIKDLVAGLGEIVEGPISKNLYTADNVDFEPYVVDFSAEFLDKSLTITVPDLKKHRVLAQEIEKIWEEKLGLTVTINLAAPEVIRDHVIPARDFEVLLYGQQVGQDPDRYVNWHSTQSDYPGLNLTGFDQMRADRALEEGRAILDSEERKIHYNDFQHNLMENTPVIFLHHPYINYYISNRVSGADSYFTEVGDSGGVFNARDRFRDFSEWKKHFLN